MFSLWVTVGWFWVMLRLWWVLGLIGCLLVGCLFVFDVGLVRLGYTCDWLLGQFGAILLGVGFDFGYFVVGGLFVGLIWWLVC